MKKIILTLLLSVPLLKCLTPSSVFAAASGCDLNQCQGRPGICETGAIRVCDLEKIGPKGNYECTSAGWVATTEETNDLSCVGSASAASTWFNRSVDEWQADLESGSDSTIDFTKYSFASTQNTLMSLGQLGVETTPKIAQAVTTMYAYKPAHVGTYLADLGKNAKIVQPAYAQGLGFAALDPVMGIWKASRNFAYLAFTLIFVVIGILIMIRQKIDPQTVISLQQALPRMVVTLLLITFSYAIAGFVIDIMYVLINLSIQLFKTFGLYEKIADFQSSVMGNSIFVTMFKEIFGETATDTASAVGSLVSDIFGSDEGFGLDELLGATLGYVIIVFMLVYAGFKTFITLALSYVKIIIGVIVGPIQIMLNAIPGSDSFKKWLMGLLSNIAPFVMVVVMLLIAGVLMGNEEWGANPDYGYGGSSASSDIVNDWTVPLINIHTMESLKGLLALGLLMLMPTAAQMAQDFFKVEAFKYGSAIGEASKFGWGSTIQKPVQAGEAFTKGYKGPFAGTPLSPSGARDVKGGIWQAVKTLISKT